MPDNAQQRPRRRRKKRNPLYGPLSFIVICAAMIFGMSVFFRVSTIEVTGINRYTEQDVIEASGLEEGDNLFFINRSSATSRIFAKLPYIEKAAINRKLPAKLVIEVSESKAIAYLTDSSGGIWIIDRGCKLLEQSNTAGISGLIRVDGISLVEPISGEQIAAEDGLPKVAYLSQILWQIQGRRMELDISRIDISNVGSPSFDYQGRFTIRLGPDEIVEDKFDRMVNVVNRLAPGDTGTIDLSVEKQANFTPQ